MAHLELADAQAAESWGLIWRGRPYGVLLCLDEQGREVTAGTQDIDYHRMLIGSDNSVRANLEIRPDLYPMRHHGWPNDIGWLA